MKISLFWVSCILVSLATAASKNFEIVNPTDQTTWIVDYKQSPENKIVTLQCLSSAYYNVDLQIYKVNWFRNKKIYSVQKRIDCTLGSEVILETDYSPSHNVGKYKIVIKDMSGKPITSSKNFKILKAGSLSFTNDIVQTVDVGLAIPTNARNNMIDLKLSISLLFKEENAIRRREFVRFELVDLEHGNPVFGAVNVRNAVNNEWRGQVNRPKSGSYFVNVYLVKPRFFFWTKKHLIYRTTDFSVKDIEEEFNKFLKGAGNLIENGSQVLYSFFTSDPVKKAGSSVLTSGNEVWKNRDNNGISSGLQSWRKLGGAIAGAVNEGVYHAANFVEDFTAKSKADRSKKESRR